MQFESDGSNRNGIQLMTKSLISLLLLLWTILSSEPNLGPQDVQELCPLVSNTVLRGAPWTCQQAAIEATMARIERRLHRIEEGLRQREERHRLTQ
jgi:hypothetical protein